MNRATTSSLPRDNVLVQVLKQNSCFPLGGRMLMRPISSIYVHFSVTLMKIKVDQVIVKCCLLLVSKPR